MGFGFVPFILTVLNEVLYWELPYRETSNSAYRWICKSIESLEVSFRKEKKKAKIMIQLTLLTSWSSVNEQISGLLHYCIVIPLHLVLVIFSGFYFHEEWCRISKEAFFFNCLRPNCLFISECSQKTKSLWHKLIWKKYRNGVDLQYLHMSSELNVQCCYLTCCTRLSSTIIQNCRNLHLLSKVLDFVLQ